MTSFSLSGLSKKNDQPIFAAFGWGHLVAKQGEHPGNDLANDGAFIDDQNFLRGLLFSISLSKSRNIPLDYSISAESKYVAAFRCRGLSFELGGGVSNSGTQ